MVSTWHDHGFEYQPVRQRMGDIHQSNSPAYHKWIRVVQARYGPSIPQYGPCIRHSGLPPSIDQVRAYTGRHAYPPNVTTQLAVGCHWGIVR